MLIIIESHYLVRYNCLNSTYMYWINAISARNTTSHGHLKYKQHLFCQWTSTFASFSPNSTILYFSRYTQEHIYRTYCFLTLSKRNTFFSVRFDSLMVNFIFVLLKYNVRLILFFTLVSLQGSLRFCLIHDIFSCKERLLLRQTSHAAVKGPSFRIRSS